MSKKRKTVKYELTKMFNDREIIINHINIGGTYLYIDISCYNKNFTFTFDIWGGKVIANTWTGCSSIPNFLKDYLYNILIKER